MKMCVAEEGAARIRRTGRLGGGSLPECDVGTLLVEHAFVIYNAIGDILRERWPANSHAHRQTQKNHGTDAGITHACIPENVARERSAEDSPVRWRGQLPATGVWRSARGALD